MPLTEDIQSLPLPSPNISNESRQTNFVMRHRRMWIICLVLAFFYVILICNNAAWDTFNINTHAFDNIISGSGFRKLLEERARLADKLHLGGKQQHLPHCIIIGIRKCGTRALLEFLDLHEGVQIAKEEVHYFDDLNNFKEGVSWYRSKMPLSYNNQITVEKTPRYFIESQVPERIHNFNNTVKLVVILRNPTTRVISDYTQIYYNKLARNETHEDFEKLVLNPFTGEINVHFKAIQTSIYHSFFPSWYAVFPKKQIHIVDGDNLLVDPVAEISKVELFLGLKQRVTYDTLFFNKTRGFYCMKMTNGVERCLGASKGRRHPDMNPALVKKMNKFFKPHNERLFRILKRRFNWS